MPKLIAVLGFALASSLVAGAACSRSEAPSARAAASTPAQTAMEGAQPPLSAGGTMGAGATPAGFDPGGPVEPLQRSVLDGGAGTVRDAAMIPGDAGMVRGDAGMIPGDAGMVPGDAGMVPGDAGMIPGDAGMVPGDAGMRPGDAGMVPGDAGMRPGDAGMRPGDAGTLPGDAGQRLR